MRVPPWTGRRRSNGLNVGEGITPATLRGVICRSTARTLICLSAEIGSSGGRVHTKPLASPITRHRLTRSDLPVDSENDSKPQRLRRNSIQRGMMTVKNAISRNVISADTDSITNSTIAWKSESRNGCFTGVMPRRLNGNTQIRLLSITRYNTTPKPTITLCSPLMLRSDRLMACACMVNGSLTTSNTFPVRTIRMQWHGFWERHGIRNISGGTSEFTVNTHASTDGLTRIWCLIISSHTSATQSDIQSALIPIQSDSQPPIN